MALDQSALLELLEALKTTDVDERVRSATEHLYQALIDAELTAVIGTALHQRTYTRTGQRNGSQPATDACTRRPGNGHPIRPGCRTTSATL